MVSFTSVRPEAHVQESQLKVVDGNLFLPFYEVTMKIYRLTND